MKLILTKQLTMSFLTLAFCANLALVVSACPQGDRSLREFDPEMVATPAELFEALSTLRPEEQRGGSFDRERFEQLEKAGQDFLSKLTPDQQEKAWEFAEKYLRQNGVDSTTSQALMDEFGVPSEIQTDLVDRYKEFQQTNNPGRAKSKAKEISDLLQRAKDRTLRRQRSSDGRQSDDGNQQGDSGGQREDGSENRNAAGVGERNLDQRSRDRNKSGEQGSGDPRQVNGELGGRNGIPNRQGMNQRAGQEFEKRFGSNLDRKRQASGDDDPFSKDAFKNDQKSNQRNSFNPNDPNSIVGNSLENDPLERFKRDLERSRNRSKNAGRNLERDGTASNSQADGTGQDPFRDLGISGGAPKSNGDWEKLIRKLAESRTKDSSNVGFDSGGGTKTDSIKIDARQREKIQNAFKAMTEGDSVNREILEKAGNALSSAIGKSGASEGTKERLTARFDKLMVKAAKRTMGQNEDGSFNMKLPDSMDSTFEKLVDRVHDSVTGRSGKKSADAYSKAAADARLKYQNSARDRFNQNSASNSGGAGQNNSAGTQGGSSGSSGNSSPNFTPPSMPEFSKPDFNPAALFDSLPDLSNVSPSQVFTFVGVIGLAVFLIYLLMRSFSGEASPKRSKRNFAKEFRNAKINTPKDLVEAFDSFLVSKFGSDSQWWNAKHAKDILDTSAPNHQSKIGVLIKDYVHARYMRSELKLSDAEQKRYKSTLLELASVSAKTELTVESSQVEG